MADSRQESSSWEANFFPASEEISRILWNPVGCMNPLLGPILSQINPSYVPP